MVIKWNTEESSYVMFQRMEKITYRISCQNAKINKQGTGFVISHLDGRLVLCTAKHVLEVEPASPKLLIPVVWTVERFNSQTHQSERKFVFQLKPRNIDTDKDDAIGHWMTHNDLDFAFIFLPKTLHDGTPVQYTADDAPIPLGDVRVGKSPTTEVHWMGYPYIAEDFLGFPQLLYYRGRISAMVDNASPCYLVDGHTARGVSGGPVWARSEELFAPFPYFLIGVVTRYAPTVPVTDADGSTYIDAGYVVVTPSNEAAKYWFWYANEVRKLKGQPEPPPPLLPFIPDGWRMPHDPNIR